MKILGLDIGTTTISAVVVEDKTVLSSITLKNDSFLHTQYSWEKVQDPNSIRYIALQAVEYMMDKYPDVERIGVTGQMHGIVYLDNRGIPLSPLYTWQDGRGNLPYTNNMTYVEYLSHLTGYSLSTGLGFVTHFYNIKNQLVPQNATVFCTIHDYIAMILAGLSVPVSEASNAASLGLFRVDIGEYDENALKKVGIENTMIPCLTSKACIGFYRKDIPVYVAIGDNQASYIGSTGGCSDCMLVNIGTGSQFSVFTDEYMICPGLETRPFPGGGYLVVGASLCGGRAYALMENFIRETINSFTGIKVESCYDAMDRLLSSTAKPNDLPCMTPLFQGTREEPAIRGSITEIDTVNFTILHFVWSLLEGMAKELHDMYLKFNKHCVKNARLVGSGNGLRKNIHLQNCIAERFEQPLMISVCNEEAATGAALYAESCK